MTYQFIFNHQDQFPLKRLCRVLSIRRSGYYGWLTSMPGKWSQENAKLLQELQKIHGQNCQIYGSPRITKPGHQRGNSCSRARAARLMSKNNIFSKTKPNFKVTTYSEHDYSISPNLLKQHCKGDAPNKGCLSDITSICTLAG